MINKIFLFIKNQFLKIWYKKPRVISSIETIEYVKRNKCNIGRFGDGELELINKHSINFQNYSKKLEEKLRSIDNTENFLCCIPSIFDASFNKILLTTDEYRYWKRYKLKSEYKWRKMFGGKLCGDAFLTRFYLRYKDKSRVGLYVKKLKELWQDKNILIVEGKTSQIGVGNDILNNSKSIRRIICPNINAFDFYDEILNAVKKHYKKDDLVLIALGPTATVLAYDLSKENIWALDMGHFDIEYEWYLAKTDKKIPVKNKHVNECGEIGVQDSANMEYLNQIIKKIGND